MGAHPRSPAHHMPGGNPLGQVRVQEAHRGRAGKGQTSAWRLNVRDGEK